MDGSGSILLILFILMIFSALFAGAETALLSLEASKIRAMQERKVMGIGLLEKIKQHPKKLIITILVWNNIINVLIPVLTTVWATNLFGNEYLGVITGVISLLLIIFGEILPKNLAIAHNEKYALMIAPLMYAVMRISFPLVYVLEKFSDALTPHHQKSGITEEEVLALVSMGAENGGITREQKMHIGNLLEFSSITAEEIMTPRTKIQAVENIKTLKEAREFMLENAHTRVPVFQDDLDHITDIITLRDILESSEEYEDEKLVKNLDLRSPYFVPITKKISALFKDFQKQGIHMAIVVDEYGGTAGLVTMEDIFEEIFGDIRDESDEDEDTMIQRIEEKSWRLSPRMTVDEVFENTGIWITEEEDDTEKSLSLFLLEKLERFPRKGESIEFETCTLTIEKIGNKTVELIRLTQK